ncbi:MAG TPA: glycosyltransferase family 2 protein, partial [Streptococcus parasuis]|nr:glycosyltransferase family 2 protein [Streptococcus parasuis]
MISVIVPCFNEEETIHYFYQAMEKVRMKMNEEFEYIFVNDGSKDSTLSILRSLSVQDRSVRYLSFSRNFGKEAALFAGLEAANGHLVTVMDADLQDPPEMLMEMKQMLDDDSDLDCVGTRRVSRDGEPLIRSFFATLFYKL